MVIREGTTQENKAQCQGANILMYLFMFVFVDGKFFSMLQSFVSNKTLQINKQQLRLLSIVNRIIYRKYTDTTTLVYRHLIVFCSKTNLNTAILISLSYFPLRYNFLVPIALHLSYQGRFVACQRIIENCFPTKGKGGFICCHVVIYTLQMKKKQGTKINARLHAHVCVYICVRVCVMRVQAWEYWLIRKALTLLVIKIIYNSH